MKNLFWILLLIPLFGSSQISSTATGDDDKIVTSRISPFYASLEERYVDFCKADSNKITVGYRFITDRYQNGEGFFECYNPKYRFMSINKNQDRMNFVEMADWSKPNHVYYVYGMEYERKYHFKIKEKYIEVEPIKMSPTPTFEGFVNWKKQFIQ